MGEGFLYVGVVAAETVATVTLAWSDPPFWGDRADAAFVHRLAVRRSHAGLGRLLMEWAERHAAERGRSFLCLDCLGQNARIRRYYEDLGFRLVGMIPGPTGHAHTNAHGPWDAALYEKAIGSP